ncbi:YaiO family outer membrane protein [Pedobacter sp. CAN_A7]|uniref:YaiO family outer membrane beta-barrel protein n=1 Tax=Pedobacter sp. CAN_A7 TaxID=2787722 RepID=UPI0018C8E542
MNGKRYMLYLLLLVSSFNTKAQQVDVDELFKQAIHETNAVGNYKNAMMLVKKGLEISPEYLDIRVLLGRLYWLSGENDSARIEFNRVLRTSPGQIDALGYLERMAREEKAIKISGLRNRFTLVANPTYFDRRGKENWKLLNASLGRKFKFGTVIARLNYADRAYATGYQFEIEAYPKLTEGLYSFVNVAYSGASIFQTLRSAYSFHSSFPKGWEGEVGMRYMYSSSSMFSFGGSVGKYLGSYWFNLKVFLTPQSGVVSHSYALTTRYFLNTGDDYITLIAATGVSPDDRTRDFQFEERVNLNSGRIAFGYQRLVRSRNVVGILATWSREEYIVNSPENELDFSLTFQHRF